MGAYHGAASFKTFSHQKSVLAKGKLEINLKYPPYTAKKMKLFKKFTHLK
jgi:aldehyde dehydrogenase (NAD+)